MRHTELAPGCRCATSGRGTHPSSSAAVRGVVGASSPASCSTCSVHYPAGGRQISQSKAPSFRAGRGGGEPKQLLVSRPRGTVQCAGRGIRRTYPTAEADRLGDEPQHRGAARSARRPQRKRRRRVRAGATCAVRDARRGGQLSNQSLHSPW